MTKDQLLNFELTHRHAGNGYACVQFKPEGDDRFVRIMNAVAPQQRRQAFLAAISLLSVYMRSPGNDEKGNPLPPEPVRLKESELANLTPFRDGIRDGTLKVVGTWVVPAGKKTA